MASTFTQAQLEALEEAIAEGARRVKYQDKEIEYRSLKDMLSLRDAMLEALNGQNGTGDGSDGDDTAGTATWPSTRKVGIYSSGL